MDHALRTLRWLDEHALRRARAMREGTHLPRSRATLPKVRKAGLLHLRLLQPAMPLDFGERAGKCAIHERRAASAPTFTAYPHSCSSNKNADSVA